MKPNLLLNFLKIHQLKLFLPRETPLVSYFLANSTTNPNNNNSTILASIGSHIQIAK